jgi:hypothetical protein
MNGADEAADASLSRETEQRLEVITSRFLDRFDDTQIEQIRARVERSLRLGRSLRATTLANGDGPDLVIAALPLTTTRE